MVKVKLLFCGYLYTYSTVLHNLYLYLKLLFSSINVQMSKLIANTTLFFSIKIQKPIYLIALCGRGKKWSDVFSLCFVLVSSFSDENTLVNGV